MRRANISEKIISLCTSRNKPYQNNRHFSKIVRENSDYTDTLSLLKGGSLAVSFGSAWLGWLAGLTLF